MCAYSIRPSCDVSGGTVRTAEVQNLADFAARGTTLEDLQHCEAAHTMAPKSHDGGGGGGGGGGGNRVVGPTAGELTAREARAAVGRLQATEQG